MPDPSEIYRLRAEVESALSQSQAPDHKADVAATYASQLERAIREADSAASPYEEAVQAWEMEPEEFLTDEDLLQTTARFAALKERLAGLPVSAILERAQTAKSKVDAYVYMLLLDAHLGPAPAREPSSPDRLLAAPVADRLGAVVRGVNRPSLEDRKAHARARETKVAAMRLLTRLQPRAAQDRSGRVF